MAAADTSPAPHARGSTAAQPGRKRRVTPTGRGPTSVKYWVAEILETNPTPRKKGRFQEPNRVGIDGRDVKWRSPRQIGDPSRPLTLPARRAHLRASCASTQLRRLHASTLNTAATSEPSRSLAPRKHGTSRARRRDRIAQKNREARDESHQNAQALRACTHWSVLVRTCTTDPLRGPETGGSPVSGPRRRVCGDDLEGSRGISAAGAWTRNPLRKTSKSMRSAHTAEHGATEGSTAFSHVLQALRNLYASFTRAR